jgi:hypothetical protein
MQHVSEVIEATPLPQHAERPAPVAALAPAHPQPASPLDLPAEVFRAGLDRRKANRGALMEWIRSAMVEGVDYGQIHVMGKDKCRLGKQCTNPAHFSKPSLFKPGAEKICGMLGVTAHFPTLHDYEQAALHGVQIKNIIIRCEIRDASGRVVADGVGARTLAQDDGDLNKSLKMAEKSAHIDATLRMAGLSEVFTQDIEDMRAPESAQPEARDESRAGGREARRISAAQKRRLEARIGELGLDRERVKAWIAKAWGVEHFADLTPQQYDRLDKRLEQWADDTRP